MKRRFSIALLLLLVVSGATALDFTGERLSYKVLYKWGLIQKQAGTARFHVTRNGDKYRAVVTAKSDPWADNIYHLRDTLSATMTAAELVPSVYERIAHEDGKYSHDLVTFTRNGNSYSGFAQRWRRKKGEKDISYATLNMKAEGKTIDLMTSFYYLRSLPFDSMKKGQTTLCNLFSARRNELLTITYNGIQKLKIDGREHNTHKVTFTFTQGSKKNSSDPIEAWVTTDSRRIPLKLVGKLKIGQIQCIYTGKL